MRRYTISLVGLSRRSLLLLLLLGGIFSAGLLAVLVPETPADLTEQRAVDRQLTLAVSALLRRQHLLQHDLDDEISHRCLKNYLRSLDPLKLYFYQSDVTEFMHYRDELDDMAKRGDISFAYLVFNRFLQRLDERIIWVDELLASKHDFTIDEEFVTDPDTARYAVSKKEARDRWRRRIKYDLLVLKTAKEKKEGKEASEKLTRRYHSFAKRMHQTDADELLEIYLTALTTSFDPHTNYFSPRSADNFGITMSLHLKGGIGAALRSVDGSIVVQEIIPGGPADKHGKLKAEDHIVSVGQGQDGEMVDVVDMKLGDVVQLIRGNPGTVVRLGVLPGGTAKLQIYQITRDEVQLKDKEARQVIFEEGKKPDGAPYKIGVIDLPSFYRDMEAANRHDDQFKSSTRDVHKILDEFNRQGVDGIVLDLRRNGGGSLPEAVDLTGLFIDQGPVVQVKDADGVVEEHEDEHPGMAWKGPMLVLVSKFSASASEILAGAIQDYRRGLIVGDRATHGKGTVQSYLKMGWLLYRVPNPPKRGAFKITMQQFYRPDGESTQKRGVLADVPLPSITDHMDVGEADLDYAVDFDRIASAQYTPYNLVTKDIVTQLQERSGARREKSEDFIKLADNIRRYCEQKERKTVTLNEKKFLAERAELDADQEDEEQFNDEKPKDEVVERTFYFNEVLKIMADYLDLLGDSKIAAAH